MANPEQIEILKQGVAVWNKWREENRIETPDLSNANLSRIDLYGVNLRGANLIGTRFIKTSLQHAQFQGANLNKADFTLAFMLFANLEGAKLNGAILTAANLTRTNFRDAVLTEAELDGAIMRNAYFERAKLNKAVLRNAVLVNTSLKNADLSDSHIFGISAWKLELDEAIQANLNISDYGEPIVTVDSLEVAQFIYLLLSNENLRNVLDTVGRKAVLILGRFSDDKRKEILDAIREKLRAEGFIPIVFDFERAKLRDFTETIKILAGLSLFVIADITNPRSSPLELQATIPDYMIPFAPIIQAGEDPFAMFVDLQRKYRWVLDVREYKDKEHLLTNFEEGIIKPAIEMHNNLIVLKNEVLKIRSIDEI